MNPQSKGGDLQRYVRQLIEVEQVIQLRSAQLAVTRRAVQRRLVDHYPQLRGV